VRYGGSSQLTGISAKRPSVMSVALAPLFPGLQALTLVVSHASSLASSQSTAKVGSLVAAEKK